MGVTQSENGNSGNPSPPNAAKEELIPSLGLFTTTMIVVGGVIGSGIFRKPGVMAGQVGSPELLLGIWLVAGIVTLFGALTNAEIAAMIPETGGHYVFFERRYGPFFAYLYGWAAFAVFQTASITAVAYVFAEYSAQFVTLPELSGPLATFAVHLPFIGDITPLKEIGVKGVAAMLIVALTAVNYAGVRFGGVVQNVFTIAKVAAMLALVLGAFLLPTGGKAANLVADSAVHPSSRTGVMGGHRRRVAGGVLGLRRVEQNYLHRRRSEESATEPSAKPVFGHDGGHRHLSPDECRLCLRVTDR
jgi:APA family basic amino acid/polyamine antiporter